MKTMVSSIRLPVESWKKLRALFQHYGANNPTKTAWFIVWIDKQHAKIKGQK